MNKKIIFMVLLSAGIATIMFAGPSTEKKPGGKLIVGYANMADSDVFVLA
jgi:hypothetical protein